jgi:hypothetical protein
MNEPFHAAILAPKLARVVFSPLIELVLENTLRRKLLSVQFQASKLQRFDSCAKRRKIESDRRRSRQSLNSVDGTCVRSFLEVRGFCQPIEIVL